MAERHALTILTQNLYLGADIGPLLSARALNEIPSRVDAVYRQLLATDFPARAQALARQIHAGPPDVIGLQEVARWQAQGVVHEDSGRPPHPTPHAPRPAPVTLDFLELLLRELEARGLSYQVAAVAQNGRVELPSARYGDVRLLDRDVILVREDLRIAKRQGGNYRAQAVVRIGGAQGPAVNFSRGWTAACVAKNGRAVRVVNTHLELPGDAQRAQARELFTCVGTSDLPCVLVGDFNASPDSGNGVYAHTVVRTLRDVWRTLRAGEAGLTACQAPDLQNETSLLSQRLDVIFCSPGLAPLDVSLVGADSRSRFPSRLHAGKRLWPSDHAGVRAVLALK